MQNKSGIYVFPMSLKEKIDTDANSAFPYVEISLVQQSLTGIDRGQNFRTLSIYTPDGIKNSDGVSIGSADLGNIKGITEKIIKEGYSGAINSINSADLMEATKQAGKELLSNIMPSISAAIDVSTRSIKNPNTVSTFEGVDTRAFTLTFKLVPESKEESDQIREIENMIRYYMYPEKTPGLFGALKYPATFRVKFMFGENENKYMPFYHDAFITGFDVDYNPDGNSYHSTGAPTAIEISMSFTEAFALTRNDLYRDNLDNTTGRDELRSSAYVLAEGASQAFDIAVDSIRSGS